MCGIAWYLLDDLSVEQIDELRNTFGPAVRHRGPDATQIQHVGNQLWVFHRLAIINLSDEGMQPFVSDVSGSRLMCNGEIYNYRSLYDVDKIAAPLKSDCEALLHLLDQRTDGETDLSRRVSMIDGDFAFVWRDKHGDVVIARDHVGVRPLFYAVNEDKRLCAVASEAKALIGAPGVAEVRVFPPGHMWHGGNMIRYTAAPVPRVPPISKEEARTTVRALFVQAVRKRIEHSDRAVGVLCSGGVDSSIVTCLLSELGLQDKIHVFTMEYEGGRSEDAFWARELCKRLGLKHTVFSFSRKEVLDAIPAIVKMCETYDPNTVRASIPMYLMAKQISASTDVRVVLSGEGADELFQGYNYFMRAPDGGAAMEESARLINNLHMFDLLRADRCFAAVGMEVRVPFLDQHLVSYVQSLTGDVLVGGSAEKQLLRDAFRDMERLTELRIIDRPKERFSDGCGFSYVPQLLADLSGGLPMLDDRLKAEKEHINAIFEQLYPQHQHLVLQRTMPQWAVVDTNQELLVM